LPETSAVPAAAGLVSDLFWLQAATPAAIDSIKTDFATIDVLIFMVFI
jgi:hypothetical protein